MNKELKIPLCALAVFINTLLLYWTCLHYSIWKRETLLLRERLLYTKCTCSPRFSSPSVCLLFLLGQNWKGTWVFLVDRSILWTRVVLATTFLKVKQRGILPVIVSENKTLSFSQKQLKCLSSPWKQALCTHWSLEALSPTEDPLCFTEGHLVSLLPNSL